MDSNSNGPVLLERLYLDTETVSCRLLQRIARMDMDWNFEKFGQHFQVLCYAGKNHQKN